MEGYQVKRQFLQSKLKAAEESINIMANFGSDFNCPIRKLAEQDLIRIWVYQFKLFGAEKADEALRSMFSSFERLIKNPHLGEKRDDVKNGYYCFRQDGYLIFYTMADDGVDVVAILPQSMDVIDYLR